MDLSLVEAAVKFMEAEVLLHHNANAALERVAVKIEATAKSEFGTYQPGVGPFPEWAELAESTKEDRVRQGYPEDEPLLRTGEMRDSIEHSVADLEAAIGSNSETFEYHEFGTSKMPPRPVLGPAAERNHDTILKELGGAVVAGIIGDRLIHPSLGYDSVVM